MASYTPGGAVAAEDLVRDADAAFYNAERRGGSRFELHDGRA